MQKFEADPIRTVTVYCGSHTPREPLYTQAAQAFGAYLADHAITLIYGGSNVGTMKTLADAVLDKGGKVVGVFTRDLAEEIAHRGVTELIITENLAERKAVMLKRADAVVALPGSYGTWDELFDALALKKLSTGHKLPVGVLNVGGYFDHLIAFIQRSVEVGYTSDAYCQLLTVGTTPEELFAAFAAQPR